MTERRRILILENSSGVTGAFNAVFRLAILLRVDYEFFFVIPKGSAVKPLLVEERFEVREIGMVEIRKSLTSLIIYLPLLAINALKFRKLLKRFKVDLVVNNDFYNLIPSIYVFFGGKIPYVTYVRFLPSRFPRSVVRLWVGIHLRVSRKILAVSKAVLSDLPDSQKILVQYDGVRVSELVEKMSREKRILYPANYVEGKGQQLALELFSKIQVTFPDWTLRFVGGDLGLSKNRNYKAMLVRKAIDLGISNRVEFFEFKENLEEEYIKAGLVLNFSESESFSMICLEAMSFGCVVVSNKCGGPEELITHGENGFLVDVKEEQVVLDCVINVLSDTRLATIIGDQAKSLVKDKFSLDFRAREFKELIESIIKDSDRVTSVTQRV